VCSITVSEVLAYTLGFLCAFLYIKKGRKNGFLLKVWKLFFTQRKVSIRTGDAKISFATIKFLSLRIKFKEKNAEGKVYEEKFKKRNAYARVEIWGKSLRRGTPLLKGRGRVWEGGTPSQTLGEVLR